MTRDKKEPEALRFDREVRRVYFSTVNDYRDVRLGGLRKVVAAAEGMSDDAGVTFLGLSKHWQRADEWNARKVRVTEEIKRDALKGDE